MPVTASAVAPAQFQKTTDSDSDEELDSEDLDESDGYILHSVLLLLFISLCFPLKHIHQILIHCQLCKVCAMTDTRL